MSGCVMFSMIKSGNIEAETATTELLPHCEFLHESGLKESLFAVKEMYSRKYC